MSEHIIKTEISNGSLFIPYQSKLSESVREEIVRCRDCAKLNIVGECPCGFWALENLNGFCAWGERKAVGE